MIYLPPAMLFLISQKIPDMLILVLYLLVLVFTPNYAIVSCVKKFRYADFSPYYLTHREVACIFV